MRRAMWALMVGCAAAAMGVLPATARDLPFCIKGCDFGGSRGDCTFVSYQQCQATASGRDAYCDVNPYFNASADGPSGRNHQSRRKF